MWSAALAHDTEETLLSALPSWRPPAKICVKTLGLHWKGDALLAAEVTCDDGTPIGIRPLGGGVNFAEPWTEALRREFREELRVELSRIGPPRVVENIFEHEGVTGHEVVFVADVENSRTRRPSHSPGSNSPRATARLTGHVGIR